MKLSVHMMPITDAQSKIMSWSHKGHKLTFSWPQTLKIVISWMKFDQVLGGGGVYGVGDRNCSFGFSVKVMQRSAYWPLVDLKSKCLLFLVVMKSGYIGGLWGRRLQAYYWIQCQGHTKVTYWPLVDLKSKDCCFSMKPEYWGFSR